MKSILVLVIVLVMYTTLTIGTHSDQPFVIVGDASLAASLQRNPTMEVPTILMETGEIAYSDSSNELDAESEAELANEVGLGNKEMIEAEQDIENNQAELSDLELLAHEMGAPILSELAADKADSEVSKIEHQLYSADHQYVNPREQLIDSVLVEESAETETDAEDSDYSNFMELSTSMNPRIRRRAVRAKLPQKNDYAFLDDPKNGGQPTVLKNLRGLDIYVVNTPVANELDNDNEIRPVKPPHPMSASDREKAAAAERMRKQLIHEIPQPKAAIKPRRKINTMSAYEPSLVASKPLKPLRRFRARHLDNPIFGGVGAIQLKGIPLTPQEQKLKDAQRGRFMQLGMGNDGLDAAGNLAVNDLDATMSTRPQFPPYPSLKVLLPWQTSEAIQAGGLPSSFDNRDGPPVLLDDLLPLKAQLVEDLDPLGPKEHEQESKPHGW